MLQNVWIYLLFKNDVADATQNPANCLDNINNPLGAKWRGGRGKSLDTRADSRGEQGQEEEAAAEEEWDDLSADYTASDSLCSDSGARGARPEGIRHTIICIW